MNLTKISEQHSKSLENNSSLSIQINELKNSHAAELEKAKADASKTQKETGMNHNTISK